MKDEWEELFSIRKPKEIFALDDYYDMINERVIQLLNRWLKNVPKELMLNKRSHLHLFQVALETKQPQILEIKCRAQILSGTFRNFCGDFYITPTHITFTDCSSMKQSHQYVHVKRFRYPTDWSENSTYEKIF